MTKRGKNLRPKLQASLFFSSSRRTENGPKPTRRSNRILTAYTRFTIGLKYALSCLRADRAAPPIAPELSRNHADASANKGSFRSTWGCDGKTTSARRPGAVSKTWRVSRMTSCGKSASAIQNSPCIRKPLPSMQCKSSSLLE
jgi:hypothetical protein